MEPITSTAIAVFLAPYLQKGGEKLVEKTIETLFDSRKDLADKFADLFKPEIISLGLNEESSTTHISKQLEANPEVKAEVGKKVADHIDLLKEMVMAFKEMSQSEFQGITVNAKNIGAVINNPMGTVTLNNKFS